MISVRIPLLSYPMYIGAYSWICARSWVAPRVQVGEGTVLGVASVYAGQRAVPVKARKVTHHTSSERVVPAAKHSE